MNGVAIGPLAMAAEQFAVFLGIMTFTIATAIMARRVDPTLSNWSTSTLFTGIVFARIGHVVLHWETFIAEPLRMAAFWQGGFLPLAGFVGAAIVSAFYVRSAKFGMACALAIGAGCLVWVGVGHLTRATLGQPAPPFALKQLDGPPLAFTDFAGKPIVANLWASWCPPCRREMPLLAEFAKSRQDVVFLFVNLGESPATIRSYLASEALKLNRVLLDMLMRVPRHYDTIGLPVTLFLHPDGTLASMHMGEISREVLDAAINKLSEPTLAPKQ